LTIAGTLLADSLTKELPGRLVANGIPEQFVSQFPVGGGGGQALEFTGTGDLGQQIRESIPEPFRAMAEPFIPQVVQAIHEAFAIAIASTFWVSIGAAILAAGIVLLLRERRTADVPAGLPVEA
jgi:hypothetical protein